MTNQGRAIKLTLTVKRPNGEIEKVVHPSMTFCTPDQFKQMQKATKAAGKGEVLDYEIEREEVKSTKVYRNNFEAMVDNCNKPSETAKAMTLNGKTY